MRRRRHSNELEQVRPSSIGEEELQLQLALAMSREEHEEELRKQKSDDIKLQLALDESRRQQEEEVCTFTHVLLLYKLTLFFPCPSYQKIARWTPPV